MSNILELIEQLKKPPELPKFKTIPVVYAGRVKKFYNAAVAFYKNKENSRAIGAIYESRKWLSKIDDPKVKDTMERNYSHKLHELEGCING